jgi:hypothetical protein
MFCGLSGEVRMLLVNLIVAIIFFQPIPPIPDAPEIPLVEVTLEVDALDTEVIPKNEIHILGNCCGRSQQYA